MLLVSNLRRSNWKCTVKRFFKSTVMIVVLHVQGRQGPSQCKLNVIVQQDANDQLSMLLLEVRDCLSVAPQEVGRQYLPMFYIG